MNQKPTCRIGNKDQGPGDVGCIMVYDYHIKNDELVRVYNESKQAMKIIMDRVSRDVYFFDRDIRSQTILMIRLAITCLNRWFNSNRMDIGIKFALNLLVNGQIFTNPGIFDVIY